MYVKRKIVNLPAEKYVKVYHTNNLMNSPINRIYLNLLRNGNGKITTSHQLSIFWSRDATVTRFIYENIKLNETKCKQNAKKRAIKSRALINIVVFLFSYTSVFAFCCFLSLPLLPTPLASFSVYICENVCS